MSRTIVVCDDEELIRWSVGQHLESEGFEVVAAKNGDEALDVVREAGASAVLLDLKMPGKDGLTVLREIRALGSTVPVVVLTAHGGIESAMEATRLGASGFLSKPFDLREITIALEKALQEQQLKEEVHYLRRRDRRGYGEFIGASKALTPLFDTLRRLETIAAPTVLIAGESGTGKDVIARSIHAQGPRSKRPFVAVDCAAMPEQLIESELFGHERGAFTDARTMKRGLLEVAQGGIVFLDEIGELTPGTQAKLLRALESRTFKRVGGTHVMPFDAGIVAATNRDLKREAESGEFREDLYFRLAVLPIKVPALRERQGDVALLVNHFVDRFNKSFDRTVAGVSGEAMGLLERYSWPGNVRELRNIIERTVILSDPEMVIGPNDLPSEVRFSAAQPHATFVLPDGGVNLENVEQSLLEQALDRTEGNQVQAAKLLGLTRYALRYRMKKFGLLK